MMGNVLHDKKTSSSRSKEKKVTRSMSNFLLRGTPNDDVTVSRMNPPFTNLKIRFGKVLVIITSHLNNYN